MKETPDFEQLTPDTVINSVEKAIGNRMTGLTMPLPSYINRVYELEDMDGVRFVAKFYRPGRWSYEALLDEHNFVLSCAEDEIPVVPPMVLTNGKTLDTVSGIHFAVFPKKSGREMEILEDEDWRRMGRIIGRIHVAGSRANAPSRVRLHPVESMVADIHQLKDGGFVSPQHINAFTEVTTKILDISAPLFENLETIRLHGDCHLKNFLHRPGEGIMVIDFDDMLTGPPVQDLWLLLPDHANKSRREINLMLEGYEQFREFDDMSLRLIEPLRAMRIIYFLSWCSRQAGDYKFRSTFPDWGSELFWQNEIRDLIIQHQMIEEHLHPVLH